MVLHQHAADGAPTVHVVVLGSRGVVAVAVGHFAQSNASAVHFAHGIDAAVSVEGQGESILAQRLVPVDAALVTIGLEAKLATCHLVVGDVGDSAGSRRSIRILLEAVAVGVGHAVGRVAPGVGVHRLHLGDGDTVDVVHHLARSHPSCKPVIVALIAAHLDARDAVGEGAVACGIADEACVGSVGGVVNVDADDTDAVLELCVVAPVPGGETRTVLVGGSDVATHYEVFHRASEVVEHACLLSLEIIVERDGVALSVEGARIRGGVVAEHEVQSLDVARQHHICAFVASHLSPSL